MKFIIGLIFLVVSLLAGMTTEISIVQGKNILLQTNGPLVTINAGSNLLTNNDVRPDIMIGGVGMGGYELSCDEVHIHDIANGDDQYVIRLGTQTIIDALPPFSGKLVATWSNGVWSVLTTNRAAWFEGNGGGLSNLPAASLPYRAGTTNVGNMATSLLVTFTSAFPSENYSVSIGFVNPLVVAVTPSANLKTTNGFTITLSSGIPCGATVDYTAWLYR